MNLFRLSYSGFRIFLYSLLVFLASCTAARYETYPSYPEADYAVASWYGPDFHGRPTASGDIYDMHALTCAHREFPFGTKLRVTNISNNRTVSCLVNDRGPFIDGRDLDLSYAAAKEIGMIGPGTCTVRIERLGRDMAYVKQVADISNVGPFTIQVGSFQDISNAMRLKMALEHKYNKVYVAEAYIDGSRYYRVRIGKLFKKDEAKSLAQALSNEGYDILITGYEEKI